MVGILGKAVLLSSGGLRGWPTQGQYITASP